MARTNITYNGTSIQTSTIVVKEIQHESLDTKRLNVQVLGIGNGGKVSGINYSPKAIKIAGQIFGSTQDDLEENIDELKRLLNEQGKNLDIEYNAGWRRYTCHMSSVNVVRRYFNLTFADFEAEFVVATIPFGQAIDTNTITQAVVASSSTTITGSYTFLGTYRPAPIIRMTVTSEVNFSRVSFRNTNTGDAIIVTQSFSAADVLIIDCQNYSVTLNGVAIDYDGFFPEFVQSTNGIKIGVLANSLNATVDFIYTPAFL